jgi:HEAT repeat protein
VAGDTRILITLENWERSFVMAALVQRFALVVAILLGTVTSWAQGSVSELIVQLKTAQGDDLMRVIDALGQSHSDKAVQPLIDIFDVPNIGLRESQFIVVALGKLKDARAIPSLSSAWSYLKTVDLGDESKFPLEVVARYQVLREEIIDAFGQIGGEAATRILISATQDDQKRIVERACQALSRLKYKDIKSLPCSSSP